MEPGARNYDGVDAAVVEAGAQDAQLTDFVAVLVMIGVLEVLDRVQL